MESEKIIFKLSKNIHSKRYFSYFIKVEIVKLRRAYLFENPPKANTKWVNDIPEGVKWKRCSLNYIECTQNVNLPICLIRIDVIHFLLNFPLSNFQEIMNMNHMEFENCFNLWMKKKKIWIIKILCVFQNFIRTLDNINRFA